MEILFGIDVGTSGCKVVAINKHGEVVCSGSQTYPTLYPKPGWAEQNPEDWYKASCQAIQNCLVSGDINPGEVVALSVDGPAHNVALMNADGSVIYPAIHWSDLRSVEQCETLDSLYGDMIYKITHQQVNPSWTLAQLMWLKENEPVVWSKLRRIQVTKDYVRYRLAGDYLTDIYDATGTQMYDVENDCWSEDISSILGYEVDWLPQVETATSISGGLTSAAAKETGLLEGTPIAVGSGDSVVEAFGIGVVEPGQCIVKIATAANVNLVHAQPHPSPMTITYPHVIEGRWFSIAATNSGASTIRWFRDTFCRHEKEQAETQGVNIYQLIEELSSDALPGCEGLLFHPYLMGERTPYWDPLLRGDFVGISARHTIHHFSRAILEGVAYSIRDCFQVVEDLGQQISEIRLIGGGTKSPLWRQIISDVLGRPLLKPMIEDAAFGAALLSGVAVSLFPDWQSALNASVKIEESLQPDMDVHARYDEYFEVYRAITRDMAEHSHQLTELASRESYSKTNIIE